MTCTRRAFLAGAAAAGTLAALNRTGAAFDAGSETDAEVLERTFAHANAAGWGALPIGEVVALVGCRFLGAPYVAHTLEADGPERLVVNLRQFDCTTFVESMLALARCVKAPKASARVFEAQLQLLRYRDGRIDGYPSRLHYFTDWIEDNDRKGVVRDLTRELGGIDRSTRIAFMSEHPGSYRQLGDSSARAAIAATERTLTARQRWYLPRARVRDVERTLRAGDIIGITTTVDGLDVAHTGIISMESGRPVFLHASLSAKRVELADGTLATYLQRYATHDGILVARPCEPESPEQPR
jgi:hypothetical protein